MQCCAGNGAHSYARIVSQGEKLVIVEVVEASTHPKLGEHQRAATLFDGNDMYKVRLPSCLPLRTPVPCGASSAAARKGHGCFLSTSKLLESLALCWSRSLTTT